MSADRIFYIVEKHKFASAIRASLDFDSDLIAFLLRIIVFFVKFSSAALLSQHFSLSSLAVLIFKIIILCDLRIKLDPSRMGWLDTKSSTFCICRGATTMSCSPEKQTIHYFLIGDIR